MSILERLLWREKVESAARYRHRWDLATLAVKVALFGGSAWVMARLAVAVFGG